MKTPNNENIINRFKIVYNDIAREFFKTYYIDVDYQNSKGRASDL